LCLLGYFTSPPRYGKIWPWKKQNSQKSGEGTKKQENDQTTEGSKQEKNQ